MSVLKVNSIQVGQSTTPTNNFVWRQPAVPDGTIRLANGNIGAETDILTINSSGNATFKGSVVAAGTSTSAADIKLYEDTDNGTNYVSLKAPASIAANVTWILPTADGTTGQYLKTDGAGNLSFSTVDALPSQTTNSGKYLTTNGTTASWSDIISLNASTGYQIGSLGVGTAASATTGEIRATNNITAFYSSDSKFKENIKPIDNALDKVKAIGGKTFDWTDEYINNHGGEDGYFIQKNDFGVIAQDVQAVFPQAVRTREDGTLAVDYAKLSVLALAAIVELQSQINDLKNAN